MAKMFKEQLERTTWQSSENYHQFLEALDQVYDRVFVLWSRFLPFIEAHPKASIDNVFQLFSDLDLSADEKRFFRRIVTKLGAAERQRQRLVSFAKKNLAVSETDPAFATLMGASLYKKLTGYKPVGDPIFLDMPFVPGLLMTDANDTNKLDQDAGSLRGWFHHNYEIHLGKENVGILFSRLGLSPHKLIVETEKSDRKTTLRHEQMHNYNLHFREGLRFFNIHQAFWGEKGTRLQVARLQIAVQNQDWEVAIQQGKELIPAALSRAKEELSADFESTDSFRYIRSLELATYVADDDSSYNPYPFLREVGVKRTQFGETEAGVEAYRAIVEEYNHQLDKQTIFLAKLFEASKQVPAHYPDTKMRIQAFMQVTPMQLWDTLGRRVFRLAWSELRPVADELEAEIIAHRKNVLRLAFEAEDQERLFGKELVGYYKRTVLKPILEQDQELKAAASDFSEVITATDFYVGKALDMTRIEPQHWTRFEVGQLEQWENTIEILTQELEVERRKLEHILIKKGLAKMVYEFSDDIVCS